jgi:hypothetical protein
MIVWNVEIVELLGPSEITKPKTSHGINLSGWFGLSGFSGGKIPINGSFQSFSEIFLRRKPEFFFCPTRV